MSAGKIAVVTGGRQGIIDLAMPEETLAAIKAAGGNAMGHVADIADEAAVNQFAEVVRTNLGTAQVLVNNAGISHIAAAESTAAADYRRVLEVNLVAPFLLAKAFGQQMLDAGRGSIINVASVAGLLGVSDRAAYNASKHGLIGLTRTLAAEWGGRGVRVNAVCPGWVKTEMDVADQAGGSYNDVDITNRVPMARFASPEDIANAIAFLADDAQSPFINGQAIAIDGGWTADASWESLRLRKR
jgi:NAD(P)-dependent dehydrogenase (short-subunit alcohol dehydrogenase family)